MKWDNMDAIYPWHYFISECFAHGHLPLWTPYCRLGQPFYGDLSMGGYYPITLLLTFFTDYSVYIANLELVIHLPIASIGMYKLLQRLGCSDLASMTLGIAYSLSGIFLSHAMHYPLFVSAAWVPFLFLFQIKLHDTFSFKNAVLAGINFGLFFTGGYLALLIIWVYVILFFHLFFIVKKKRYTDFLKNGSVFAFTSLLLGAVPLLFFIENSSLIDRGNGVSWEMASQLPFTLKSFVSFFAPLLTASSKVDFGTDISMRNSYVGILLLPFALLFILKEKNRNAFLLFGVALVFLLIAMGDMLPFRKLLYDYVPLMDSFRFPSIFRFVSIFFGVVLLAFTFDWVLKNKNSIVLRRLILFTLVSFLVVFVLSVYKLQFISFNLQIDSWENLYKLNSWTIIAIESGLAFVLFLVLLATKFKANLFSFVVVADVFIHAILLQFTTVACDVKMKDLHFNLQSYPKGFPIPNNEVSSGSFNQWGDKNIAPPIWQNAGFIRKEIAIDGFGSFNLNNYNYFMDSFVSKNDILKKPYASLTHSKSRVNIDYFSPNRVLFTAYCEANDTFVVMQMMHPEWRVKVNGKTAKFEEDVPYLSVLLGKGINTIEINFASSRIVGMLIAHYVFWTLALLFAIFSLAKLFLQRFAPYQHQ
jgi:hypothetical protein